MRLLVPLIAALVPLLITPGVLTYFDVTPKIAFLLLGTVLILLYPSENLRNVRAILRTRFGRYFLVLLGALWLAIGIATAFSSHHALSVNGSNWRRFGLLSQTGLLLFVLFAVAWLAAGRNNIRSLLRATTAAGALAALYGIAQYFGWDPFLPGQVYQAGEGPFTIVRPPGTLGHADYFAAWLVVIAFSSIALERLEETRWRKAAAFATAALGAFAILLSGTRSALLGLVAGAAFFVLAGRVHVRIRSIAALLACSAGLVLFFFSPPGARLRARLHWSREDIRGGARLLLWRDSLRMAAQHPIAGFGPETFVTESPRFESAELARAYPDFYHESPHNMFLDPLTSCGLLGLLPVLGLCALGVWAARRLILSRDALAAPLASGLAAILVCQQFTVFILPTALSFYLLLAILVAIASPPIPPIPAAEKARRIPIWYLPVAGAVAAVLAIFAVRLLVVDTALSVTERRIRAQDATAAAQVYRTVLRWQPAGTSADLRYSRDMQELSTHASLFSASMLARQEAFKAGISAVQTAEDRQNAWYNLATLFALNNDAPNVEHSLRNAIAWAPNWFKPHWALAQLLQATNHHVDALKEAATAVQLNAGHDPEVTQTWERLQKLPSAP